MIVVWLVEVVVAENVRCENAKSAKLSWPTAQNVAEESAADIGARRGEHVQSFFRHGS